MRMDYFRRFTFLFATPIFEADDLEGIRFHQIIDEIERFGFEVVKARKLEDAQIAVQTDAAIGCMVDDVEYLPIGSIAGRVAVTPFVVYPPGIATIVPGERLTGRAQPMIDYLKMFEASFNTFPGFDVEIQGVFREVDPSGAIRLHTYVASE
jgi:ornithine decarboxylase